MNKICTALIVVVFIAGATSFVPVKFADTPDREVVASGSCRLVLGGLLYAAAPLPVKVVSRAGSSDVPVADAGSSVMITVMSVLLVIWFGIAFFLYRLDRRISALERELNEE